MGRQAEERVETDVLVVGSGPVGCTFARGLVEAGRSVLMVEAGPALSSRPGAHLKNIAFYQRNLDRFGPLVSGCLHPLSADAGDLPGADPEPMIRLDSGVATYAVGGMATHWTGVTPRHHPVVERAGCIPGSDWDDLYREAESLLRTSTDVSADSVTHRAVLDALTAEYPGLPAGYGVGHLPLAGRRRNDGSGLVHWTGADTVLGPLADGTHERGEFVLREQHLCTRLRLSPDGASISAAEIEDQTTGRTVLVEAGTFVVACGAVLTPQLLHASGIRPAALGRYLTEQPVAFCRIVLDRDVAPPGDPDPNVWIPVSEDRPWHCQVHRDLPYADQVPNRDVAPWLVVDLRWFGLVRPRRENRVWFSGTTTDGFGLPEPRVEFSLSDADRERQRRMMRDLRRAAEALGEYLPGAEPRFVVPTLPLHIAGTVRMGTDADTSVTDPDSRVWGLDNLYAGGNGLIPTGTASNPTLTSVAMAVRAVRSILGEPVGSLLSGTHERGIQ